jgi:hypothetical protein
MAANNALIKHVINFIMNAILICYCHSHRSGLSHFQSNYLQLHYYAHILPFWYQDINMFLLWSVYSETSLLVRVFHPVNEL